MKPDGMFSAAVSVIVFQPCVIHVNANIGQSCWCKSSYRVIGSGYLPRKDLSKKDVSRLETVHEYPEVDIWIREKEGDRHEDSHQVPIDRRSILTKLASCNGMHVIYS